MKKLTALLLAILLCTACIAALTACGESSPYNNVTIKETTLVDEKGILAVAKRFGKYDSDTLSAECALIIDITNNSDKTVSFSLINMAVNGCVLDDSVGIVLEPGSTQTLPAALDETKLENYGIKTVADLEFCASVLNDKTYEDIVVTDPITIKTSAYEGFNYEYDESGTVMYDADGVKIVIKDGLIKDDFFGSYVNLYVVNQTDKTIDVSVVQGKVNGKTAQITAGSYTPPGKRNISILSMDEKDRPEQVDSFTLSFSVSDWDTGEVLVEKTEPVTVKF